MNKNPFQRLYDLQQERLRKAGKVTPPAEPAEPQAAAEEKKSKKSKKSNKK